ncbi:hypothetical protein FB446DRAFT_609324, partial [Lentinula raphanica]
SRHVIAKDLIEEVWKDMESTILPSWIDPPPHNWGTKAAGKLSADEWKVVCSISLVITLIRIWGYKYQHQQQSRHFQLLLNFLDLVHAIQLLNLRETSVDIGKRYQFLILQYLHNVLELFPDVSLKPNHHYAIHIAEDLDLMGPVHARNTPIFERTNHFLQEVKSNKHLGKLTFTVIYVSCITGEVEATMQKAYCQEGMLHVILEHSPDLQDDIKEALDALHEIKQENHRGMFAEADLSSWSSSAHKFKSSPIVITSATLDQIVELLCDEHGVPHSIWEDKLSRDAFSLGGVTHDGVIFSLSTRQSSVVYRKSQEEYGAGIIQRIISHEYWHPTLQKPKATIYLEVLEMTPINSEDDLYRKLKCGWLCLRQPGPPRLVPLLQVISQFVKTNLLINGQPLTHVYPMPKV